MLEAIKAGLVDDWRRLLHWWSVQWALVGAVVLPLVAMAPQVFPTDLLPLFPPSVRGIVPAVWCLIFVILRAWQQKHPNG